MKVGTPSEPVIIDTLAVTGGGFAGAMLSKATVGFIHTPTTAVDADAIKKDENTLMLKRGGLLAVGLAAAMFVSGNDTGASLVKGAGYGIVLAQGLEIVKTIAARSGVASEAASTTTGKKALARAVGLGCACSGEPALNGRGLRFTPAYDYSGMDQYAPVPTLAIEQGGEWGTKDPFAAVA